MICSAMCFTFAILLPSFASKPNMDRPFEVVVLHALEPFSRNTPELISIRDLFLR